MHRLDPSTLFELSYAGDGTALVTTARSGAVRWMTPSDGASSEIGRFEKESYALATSKDGQIVASGSFDGAVALWDVRSRAWSLVRASGKTVWNVALSADGSWLAAADDDGAWLGRVGLPLVRLPGSAPQTSGVRFSPDGSIVASTSADTAVRLWDVPGATLRTTLRGHRRRPTAPTFTPDGRTLITGGWDGDVRAWDVANGDGRLLGSHASVVRTVAISPDGRLVASGGRDGTVKLWTLANGAAVTLGTHQDEVRDVTFAPDGQSLASASYDGTVRLWDIASRGSELLRGPTGFQRVRFRSDGHQLAATCQDGTLHTWRLPLAGAVPTEPAAIRRWLDEATTGNSD
jgi:WD40 repeat protein